LGSSLEFASRQTSGPPNGPFSYIGEIGETVGVSFGNVLLPPNLPTPNCDSGTDAGNTLHNPGMIGLASHHSGGANVVMLDGSVKFLKNNIASQTLWALASIAQGEVISSDSY
jgi:prepilin-type processing-associated H-X9-DG protein